MSYTYQGKNKLDRNIHLNRITSEVQSLRNEHSLQNHRGNGIFKHDSSVTSLTLREAYLVAYYMTLHVHEQQFLIGFSTLF